MTKDRELPSLLPLEYCRIDRAARMLQCEMEDIFHWWEVGSITLHVKLPRKMATVTFGDVILNSDKELNDFLERTNCESKNLLGDGYSLFETYSFLDEDQKPYLRDGILPTITGWVSGLWVLDNNLTKKLFHESLSNIEIEMFKPSPEQKNIGFIFIESDAVVDIPKLDLWVTKNDLININNSIASGDMMPNIYNNSELAQKEREQAAKAEQRQKMIKPVTGESTMLSTLGIMAILLYESKGQSLQWGGKLNKMRIAELIKDMAVELGLPDTGFDNVRKDIGRAISQEPFKSYFQTKEDIKKQLAQK